MGLTSALNTSLNGLTLNETTIDVLGNNIANAGTNGFKASNALFATQLSRTYSVGSRPTLNSAGTNPRQVGLGANTTAIVKDFTQGNVTNSASPSDLAIEGDGFFILKGDGGVTYSRAGNFYRNSSNLLVNSRGDHVQGYGVDAEFNLITTGLTDLKIPLGELNVAQQTRKVVISGAVEPTGEKATSGTEILSAAMTDSAGPLTVNSLLTNLQNGSGTNLFSNNQVISFSPHKGGQINQTISMTVGATTTLQDFMDFMRDGLGIHTETGVPTDPTSGNAPGVVLSGNQIRVTGNLGSLNALNIQTGDLTVDNSAVQLSFTQQQAAVGESAVTNFVIYDSLGAPVNVKLATVLENVTPTSTTFRWYLDSNDDSRRSSAVTSGTVTFDGMGNVTSGGIGSFDIQRDDTAAISPMTVTLDLSNVAGISSTSAGSRISLGTQDGSGPGTLVNFVIDDGGTINGVFDNGIIRTLGQVVLARFSNVQGLVEVGDTSYSEGISSGAPFYTTPGNFGAGTIRAGSIELSNTDIGKNLVDLIVASTNYRGNARVISSVQQLVEELFVLGR